VSALALLFLALQPEDLRETYRKAESFSAEMGRKVHLSTLSANWSGERLWYRTDVRGVRSFVVADEGGRRPAFDHARLAEALSKALGKPVRADALPFDAIRPAPDLSSVEFEAGGSTWACDLSAYSVEKRPSPRKEAPSSPARERRGDVTFRDHNVFLGGEALTSDGDAKHFYGGRVSWSPDGKRFVVFRTKAAEERQVHYVESSPKDQVQPKHFTRNYAKPGDPLPVRKPQLFEVEGRRQVPIDDALFADPFHIDAFSMDRVRWSEDGKRFTFAFMKRGFQLARIIEVDAGTGAARVALEEKSDAFIALHKCFQHYVKGTDELVWMSERDGWNHLYLHDLKSGAAKPITSGEWVLRGVDLVDDEKRQVWFRGSGRNPGEDPYHVHHYRVNFDGTGLVALTEGNGTHSVQFSPGRRFLVDTWSRADRAPVHELRRGEDGKLVCRLEEADAKDLFAAGWRAPEVFSAKGRDGTTDIWGLIHRPTGFDPARKYPVVESLYAGPQDSHVPKRFSAGSGAHALAQLGFVVVQIDGMGTSNRSRAFHQVCHRNLKDAGLPDRVAWMKAAAAKYPQLDLERVGVYGTSAGAQSALGALLFHGDFYKAAVAACGCHDNRMDKVWWNEQWMGHPVGPHYAENSNVTHAARLRGKLLLIVGELDTNVDPASTMQVADALIKAGKVFDLLVVPGMGHSDGGSYGRRRTWDFFVRHLQGRDPPDWNR
jgi:dipeptidyl aminopeptidase/acylaminoacyl peptidase